MKKIMTLALSVIMLLGCAGMVSAAESAELSAKVNVTVSNKGSLVVTQKEVTVKDIDGDNALTVNDALYAVHEECYSGGAAKGYNYYIHKDYGLSLGKLWGDDSGNFGYYINDKSAWSLADAVKDGDYINAFVYADGTYFSDMYTYFDSRETACDAGEKITLTLCGAGYDASWNPVTVPVANAIITVNGVETSYKTDENGRVEITLSEGGVNNISAVLSSSTIVPPVCVVTVTPLQEPSTTEETTDITESEITDVSEDESVEIADNEEVTVSVENTGESVDSTESNGTSQSAAKTGDTFAVFMSVSVISVIGLAVVVYEKKKNEKAIAYEE